MTDEKWLDIIAKVKDGFEILEHETQDLPEEAGRGSIEYIIFNGPLGRMKLERTTQPLVVDKKTIGSRRIGSETKVNYIYSDTEQVHKFKAYRWSDSDGGWVEMAMERGDMIF